MRIQSFVRRGSTVTFLCVFFSIEMVFRWRADDGQTLIVGSVAF